MRIKQYPYPRTKKSVASNDFSIAEAHFYPDTAWYRAVYLNDTPVGFVMLEQEIEDISEEDKPSCYLWRLMIANNFQGQGLGKKVLDIIVEKVKSEGKKYLYTSCTTEQKEPYGFYIKYGFTDTKKIEDGETFLKYKIFISPDDHNL